MMINNVEFKHRKYSNTYYALVDGVIIVILAVVRYYNRTEYIIEMEFDDVSQVTEEELISLIS